LDDANVQLVRRAQRADAQAFAELIHQHERMALAVAMAIVGEPSTAGDVVQDAFLRAWQRMASLKEPARFAAWLCGIVRNLAIDEKRRIKPVSIEAATPKSDASVQPLENLRRQEECDQVVNAMGSLDQITRVCLTLRYYDNLSSKQISAIVELSAEAVDARISRGRAEMRKILSETMAEAPATGCGS
jgi:RNA polymerase sigma-70 factor, ECF subfamily